MLDIRAYNGQLALRGAGLFDSFLKPVRPSEDEKRVVDKDGNVLLDRPGTRSSDRPEVDRGELRQMLIDSIPARMIRWDQKIISAAAKESGRYELLFSSGETAIAAAIVGADGAWSKVRAILSSTKPEYTGTCFVETTLFDGDARHRASAAAIGRGTLMAVAPGKGILAHRHADGRLQVYAALNKSEKWMASMDFSDAKAGLARIADQFEGWAPELRSLITEGESAPILRPIHALPVGFRWSSVPGVTLLGDAAHLMSPFAGEGANLALHDGAMLGRAIVDNMDDTNAAFVAYESDMFVRSAKVAEESARNLARFFGSSAPGSVVELFSGLR